MCVNKQISFQKKRKQMTNKQILTKMLYPSELGAKTGVFYDVTGV